jgi:hypothetical protein
MGVEVVGCALEVAEILVDGEVEESVLAVGVILEGGEVREKALLAPADVGVAAGGEVEGCALAVGVMVEGGEVVGCASAVMARVEGGEVVGCALAVMVMVEAGRRPLVGGVVRVMVEGMGKEGWAGMGCCCTHHSCQFDPASQCTPRQSGLLHTRCCWGLCSRWCPGRRWCSWGSEAGSEGWHLCTGRRNSNSAGISMRIRQIKKIRDLLVKNPTARLTTAPALATHRICWDCS